MDEVRGGIVAVAQDQPVAVQASGGEAASERFWEPIRGRLISFRNLSVPLRALLLLVVALVVAGAVLLGTLGLHQPMIAVTVDQGQAVELPVSIFALTVITFPLAWALLIAGSIRSFWPVRFLILGAFTEDGPESPRLEAGDAWLSGLVVLQAVGENGEV
jgi:hypothetical protein